MLFSSFVATEMLFSSYVLITNMHIESYPSVICESPSAGDPHPSTLRRKYWLDFESFDFQMQKKSSLISFQILMLG